MARRKHHPRKLLVASTGLLTVSYVGACDSPSEGYSVANLMPSSAMAPVNSVPNMPQPNPTTIVANLIAPPVFSMGEPATTAPLPTMTALPPSVGNLVPFDPTPTAVPTATSPMGPPDAAAPASDAGPSDAGPSDAGLSDAGPSDAGLSNLDASLDGSIDAGSDADSSVSNDGEADGGP